jgi:hypothetical protein
MVNIVKVELGQRITKEFLKTSLKNIKPDILNYIVIHICDLLRMYTEDIFLCLPHTILCTYNGIYTIKICCDNPDAMICDFIVED